MPEIRLIEAKTQERSKQRVTAYCRVSSDSADQLASYWNQVTYYTDYIGQNSDWEFAGIYADEGLTGTSAARRPEFQKLMELCKRGKVDMILSKSISRFARNTVDSLSYIRMLKELGVAVVFEKEGINTMEVTSELLISFMSAFAQAESESLSMNVMWGKRRSFQKGNVTFQYSRFYGYERGEDNRPKIVPEQAEVVRRIYNSYLAGQSVKAIKTALESEGVPSSTGKPEWSVAVLQTDMMTLIKNSVGMEQKRRNAAFEAIADEIKALRDRQEAQGSAQANAENRRSRLDEMIAVLEGHDFSLGEYDDRLVRQMVEQVRVLGDGKVAVRFELGPEFVCELGEQL